MPLVTTSDGVALHYEDTARGDPILFIHEFAGDAASWEPQVRHFSSRYRAITYNARGQRTAVQYGNGVTSQLEYDPLTFNVTRFDSRR